MALISSSAKITLNVGVTQLLENKYTKIQSKFKTLNI